jgi:hypothetical protein
MTRTGAFRGFISRFDAGGRRLSDHLSAQPAEGIGLEAVSGRPPRSVS